MSPAYSDALLEAYRTEANLFRQALGLGAEVLAALQQGHDAREHVQRLLDLVAQTGEIETKAGSLHAQTQDSQQERTPAIEEAIQLVLQLSQRLQACIQEAEGVARARKSQLEPQLDALIRASQMQRAYGKWR